MAVSILVGDTRDRLKDIPDTSIQCVVTSPPYFGLRDYGVAGQIGLEPTLSGYIAALVDVFREVRRVLRDDGVVFLNLGDSYNSNTHWSGGGPNAIAGNTKAIINGASRKVYGNGLKPKDLMMVPARVAIALCDDGWFLRSHIIWAKKAPMPESVTDRPTSAHESIFLLTKSARYFWDQEAVREEATTMENRSGTGKYDGDGTMKARALTISDPNPNGRNLRNVWTLGPEPFPGAHFATMPTEIPRRAIKAGTSERGCCAACGAPWTRIVNKEITYGSGSGKAGNVPNGKNAGQPQTLSGEYDIRMGPQVKTETLGWQPGCRCDAGVVPCKVLDPFFGSGTTGLVADELGRDCIGVELNPEYAEIARNRIFGAAPLFASVDVA